MSMKRTAVAANRTNFRSRVASGLAVVGACAFALAMIAAQPRHALAQAAAPAASATPFVLTGEEEYLFHCASCHGLKGRGDGPAAGSFTVRPADLTQLARRNGGVFPEQRAFATIDGNAVIAAHGTREMPVWGQIFEQQGSYTYDRKATAREVRARIQRLVDYLKSLQRR